MISVLIESVKKLKKQVNHLNELNKLIVDCNARLGEKVGCFDGGNECVKETCQTEEDEGKKKKKRLQDEYQRISKVGLTVIEMKLEVKEKEIGMERKRKRKLEKEKKRFMCEVRDCGKKFKRKQYLNQHMNVHSNS
jgi:hypothetical protein